MTSFTIIPMAIFLLIPVLSVVVSSSGNPIEGQNYSLTCAINGVESLTNVIKTEYQWHKDENISSSPTLNFTPLTLNDSGTYTCTVNITSPLLNDTHTAINETTLTIRRKLLPIECIMC